MRRKSRNKHRKHKDITNQSTVYKEQEIQNGKVFNVPLFLLFKCLESKFSICSVGSQESAVLRKFIFICLLIKLPTSVVRCGDSVAQTKCLNCL